MIRTCVLGWVVILAGPKILLGQEYQVSQLNSPAPADAVAPQIAALLKPAGIKIAKGSGPAVLELWLAKEWSIAADAQTSAEVLYPLTPGQIFGVARFPRKAADFRDQEVPAGTYVVRYAHQPVDGAHVGTSPTRDFLALLPAAKDREAAALDYKTLVTISKETTGTAHPAILSLQTAQGGGEPLGVLEDADLGWVIVHFVGQAKRGGMASDLPVQLVVVGKAAE